jgi:hypothetical protein
VIGGVDVTDPGRSDVGTENGNGHMKAAFRIVLERSAWSDGWERVETEPASRVVASTVNGGAKEQTALDARRGQICEAPPEITPGLHVHGNPAAHRCSGGVGAARA